jgi:hypothetical protein
MLHYFADLSNQLKFFLLTDIVNDTTVDTVFILPKDQSLNIIKCTFCRICYFAASKSLRRRIYNSPTKRDSYYIVKNNRPSI